MTSKELKLLAYGRVSDVRGRQGPGFISPEDQMERVRGYAKAYGHKIIEEGLDSDISGSVMTRPVFDRFLGAVKAGQADGIIVAKLDRFARSSSGALAAIEEIEAEGGVLISVAEQIDSTTPAGKFLRTILLAAAQWERERIGEAWKSARTRAVARGIHVSRHVPPGYKRLPKSLDETKDRLLVPHPKHAGTIKRAYEMAAQGESYTAIAQMLTAASLPTGQGRNGTWNANRIRRLLANRVYLGEARSGEGNANPAAHEALVDQGTWTLAQRKPAPGLTVNAETLLAGLCRCASCSFAMRSQGTSATGPASYRCSTTTVHGRCPAPSSVSLKRLEEHVLEQFLARKDLRLSPADDGSDESMEAALAAERSYRAALLDTDLRRRIGDADHGELVATLHREWEELLAEVKPRQRETSDVNLRELVAALQEQGNVRDLRELLAAEIQAVFVRPAKSRSKTLPIADRVRIVWQDEPPLELPRRGKLYEPRAFVWG